MALDVAKEEIVDLGKVEIVMNVSNEMSCYMFVCYEQSKRYGGLRT